MKRLISLFLAAALGCGLLTGCNTAPPLPAASSAASPAVESAVSSLTPLAKPLKMTFGGSFNPFNAEHATADGMYALDGLDLTPSSGSPALMTFYDFNTMEQRILCEKPGCSHQDKTCPAYMPTSYQGDQTHCELLGIVDGVLYWILFEGPVTAYTSAVLQKQVLDGGSFPESIAALDPNDWRNFWFDNVYSDGEYFYLILEGSFVRLSPTDGSLSQVVPKLPAGTYGGNFRGLTNDGRALYLTAPDDTRNQLFAVDSLGTVEPVFSFPDNIGTFSLWQGLFYYNNKQDGSIYVFDPVTRENQLLTTALAPYARYRASDDPMSQGYYEADAWQFKRFGDWLFVDGVRLEENSDDWWRVGVNLVTGEVRTDLELGDFWNGYVHPLTIWAETPYGLLVTPGRPRFVLHTRGNDGSPYDQETDYNTYAFLSLEDYLANRPNYRQIASLPHN